MKKGIISVLLFITVVLLASAQNKQKNLYDFTVIDIDGKKFDLSQFKGKKVMIVNVASKCGFTPQYELLQELYDEYKDTGFV
ncbi:MAG TPA: glutathione peroxidase, partial [Porphyromonadaceae bacterium]|nr:glutathione peroxidase [Porphyromonadaceae bacterium]